MFTDLPDAPSAIPLWADPLEARLSRLMARPRRVAWLYRSPDTSTFRYRAHNMVTALNSDPDSDIGAAWFSENELDEIVRIVDRLDAVVVTRYPFCAPLSRVIARARQHDVPVVFDVDDMVFDVAFAPLIMDALDQDLEHHDNWSAWYGYLGQVQESMRWCGGALTSTEPLKGHLEARLGDGRVGVVPNFFEPTQQAYSRDLLQAKRDSGWRRTEQVTIGYFSGSRTHAKDFAVLSPALHRLLRSDPGVRLRVVGRLDILGDLADLPDDQIEVVGFMDYVELQRSIAEVEINLAPLQQHPFTACKSDLKYFEAAAVGTWTVASPAPAFVGSITDGRTGRLARSFEWDAALREAVELARDAEAFVEHAEAAAAEVHERFGWANQSELITASLATAMGTGVSA